jgi:hypothetical protein
LTSGGIVRQTGGKSTATMNVRDFRCFAVLLTCVLLSVPASAQTDDFNDGNDAGWSRYAPLTGFGAAATYTVTNGVYHITSAASPNEEQLGPSRAGALRSQVYGTFYVSVDLVHWDPAEDTSLGVLARISSAGLGTTNGYAFTYQGKDTDVQISRVDNEAPTDLSGSIELTLAPGGSYRMVFFGVGSYLEGRIYDLNDLMTPLITATGFDSTHASGTTGLVVFADENTRAAAGFDNSSAHGGGIAPPELVIAGGELRLDWDAVSSLGYIPEWSVDLGQWSPLTAQGVESGAFYFKEAFVAGAASPVSYYRLRLGPAPVFGAAAR